MVTPFLPVVTIGARQIAPEAIIAPLEIAIGRQDPTAQPDSSAVSLELLGELPAEVRVGAPLTVARSYRGVGPWGPGYSGDQPWADLWSEQLANDPVLLPGAPLMTQEDFDAWQRFWGFSGSNVTASFDAGRGVTVFPPAATSGDVTWQGPPMEVDTIHRQIVCQSYMEATAPASAGWEVLWSATNPAPDYFGSDVSVVTDAASVTFGPDSPCWAVVDALLPAEARYIRVGLRILAADDRTVWHGQVSATLTVGDTPDAPRFTGTVSDLSSELSGGLMRTELTATGLMAALGSDYVGDTPWPVESDADRAATIAGLARTLVIAQGTPSLDVRARDVDRQPVLDLLQEQAASTGAILWERADGVPVYAGPETRGQDTTPATLTAQQIIDGPAWAQSIGRHLTGARILYGPDDARASVTVGGGAYVAEISTILADLASAEAFGALVMRRWGDRDYFDAPAIETDTRILSDDAYESLLTLKPGDRLATQGLGPIPSTHGGQGDWIVEGYQEAWDIDDAGDLFHSFIVAVSDFRRFSVVGLPTITNLELSAERWTFGTPYTGLVRVTDLAGSPITAGQVQIEDESGRVIAGPVDVVDGTVTVNLSGSELMPGSHTLLARYSGAFAEWQASASEPQAVTVDQPTGVAVGFSLSPNPVNNGQNAGLYASVSGAGSTPTGTITWQYAAPGAGWADWVSDTLDSGGNASRLWQSNTPGDWQWRAHYTPAAGSPYSPGTSAAVPVRVRQLVYQVLEYVATWSAAYRGDGTKRTDTADMYQGRYSSTNGNQRSLAGGFGINPASWSGWQVTQVLAYFYFDHWYSASGGTAVLGYHQYGSPPASSPGIGVSQHVGGWGRDVGQWVDITSWGQGFASGNLLGLATGPAPDDGIGWYGYAHGAGGNAPRIRISGQAWV